MNDTGTILAIGLVIDSTIWPVAIFTAMILVHKRTRVTVAAVKQPADQAAGDGAALKTIERRAAS
jgi:hypothetical protein